MSKKSRTFAPLFIGARVHACIRTRRCMVVSVKRLNMNEIVKYEQVKDKVIILRGEPVLLDADVAALYGVETRVVNQAVKNNLDKFPTGYLFKLDKREKENLRSKFLIARIRHKVIREKKNEK